MHLNTKNNSTYINTRRPCIRIVSPFFFPEAYLSPHFWWIHFTDWYTKDLCNIQSSICNSKPYVRWQKWIFLIQNVRRVRHKSSWQGRQIFRIHILKTWLKFIVLTTYSLYNIGYLHMCLGQRGGWHSLSHHRVCWSYHTSKHMAHSVRRRTLENMTEMTILPRFSCARQTLQSMKAQWGRAAPALRTASTPLTCHLSLQCETGVSPTPRSKRELGQPLLKWMCKTKGKGEGVRQRIGIHPKGVPILVLTEG